MQQIRAVCFVFADQLLQLIAVFFVFNYDATTL